MADESLGVRELRVGEWRMNGRVERVEVLDRIYRINRIVVFNSEAQRRREGKPRNTLNTRKRNERLSWLATDG